MKSTPIQTTPFSRWDPDSLSQELFARFGPLIGGRELAMLLGYPSVAALIQADRRKKVGVRIFEIENRRGRFAFSQDVGDWLAALRTRTANQSRD